MHAAQKSTENIKILQELVPLNALSEARFNDISEKIVIEVVKSGRYLFRRGDRDNRTIYLLEGKVSLIDGARKVVGEIQAGTDVCLHPIANQQPRSVSVRVVEKAVIAYIDSGLLDAFLTWDQSNAAEAVDIGFDDPGDWMTRLLQTETFSKLPPSMLQSLLMKMEPLSVEPGDVIVSQGEEGDYFYTIHEGRCQVTSQLHDDGEVVLAELAEGDSFGEEALVSPGPRNASVTMLTRGLLMRLAKEDFDALLKTQLLKYINYEVASTMIDEGAVWLDVRTPDEYQTGAFEDSVNIPLAGLRGELPELVFNARYIICCDTGRRSDSAGFVLSHKGLDVYVLENGMSGLLPDSQITDAAPGEGMSDGSTITNLDDSHDEIISLQHTNEALIAELDTEVKSGERMTGQIEQLRGELSESVEKLGELYARVTNYEEEKQQLQHQYAALQETLDSREEEHKITLEQEQKNAAAMQNKASSAISELESQSGERGSVVQTLEQQKHQLQEQLSAEQARVAEIESQSISRDDASAELYAQVEINEQLTQKLLMLESHVSERKADLDASATLRESQEMESDKQVEALNEALAQATAELSVASGEVEKLQAENSRLASSQEKTAVSLDEQAENQQDFEAQQLQLQSGFDAERADLQLSIKQEQEIHAGLNEELQQVREQSSAAHEEIERERESLQQQLAQSVEEKGQQESELESLRKEIHTLVSAEKERVGEFQEQLDIARQHTEASAQLGSEKDSKIEVLEQEVADSVAEKRKIDEEAGLLQQRLDEALELLQQREGHAQELESDFAESLSKSHEELTQKNDTEKELQGQIDRLRKKLGQVSSDSQKLRDDARDDLDSIREELHHERQARAEERSQMAARQRELKEQLGAIATQHEENMTDQSGAIEQARDAARAEERSHLQSVIESQAETEEQLVRVQEELRSAHEEIVLLDQQEKARRQVEIDLVQEQNRQAEAAITQLETQLKQLTRERDATLEDQHELRVKMNALRGEVEVARGLMTRGGQGSLENPEQLRAELDETRNNVKIAVRLRAEAEAARDRMAAELQRLGASPAGGSDDGKPLHIPSLDAFAPGKESSKPAAHISRNVIAPGSVTRQPVSARKSGRSGGRRGLVAGIGLVVTAVLVFAWYTVAIDKSVVEDGETVAIVTSEVPVPADVDLPREENSVVDETVATVHASQPDSVSGGIESQVAMEQARTAVTEFFDARPAAKVMTGQEPVEAEPEMMVGQAVESFVPANVVEAPLSPLEPQSLELVGPPAKELPVLLTESIKVKMKSSASALPAVARSYRDKLTSGGKAPPMVALRSAQYQMGSLGNSLNFDEGPRHQVKLQAFSISKREVTFAEYDAFARATGRRLPYDETWGRGRQPVINITWQDATAYTRWLSRQTGKKYRLPTEAEWEYAARSGSKYSHWWADIKSEKYANCFDCGSKWDGKQTAPAGSFSSNSYGLHDMAGNVQEWTSDCYQGSYVGAPADGSAWSKSGCTQRVVRGGAYSSPLDSLRSAKRAQLNQDTRLDNLGFRVVRDN